MSKLPPHLLSVSCWFAVACASLTAAPTQPGSSIAELKKLSMDELMKTEVTSVSKYSQPLMDAAASIRVLSNEDIRRSTAVTIPEALRLADNLNVAQKNPHDWAISARGFNANVGDKMLVLIDGRSVYTPLFAGVFWNAQDYLLEDVDRIEAISGPGGTLWGANAVNGVINITTKPAQETQGAYLDATAGTWLHESVGLRYGGRIAPNVYYRVYGKYLSQGSAEFASGARASDSWRQGQFGFRIDALPDRGGTVTVQGDGYSSLLNLQSGGAARIAGGNLLARWSLAGANGVDTQVQFYVDRTHLADPFAASPYAPAGFLRDDLDTYDLDVQRSGIFGQHRLVWGLGFRHIVDRVRQQAPNFGFLPAHDDKDLFSGFVQDEIALREHLALILGTKLEHNGFTGFELEPNIRLRWNVTPTRMLWTAISRAVRTPSRFDRDLVEPVATPLIKGGKDFRSETLVAYELGGRAQFNTNTDVSLSTFYHDYDRLRGLGFTPQTVLPLVYGNNLDGYTYGAELSVEHRPVKGWRLTGAYSLLREHLRIKTGRTDFFNALDETQDPEGQFSVTSSMDLPHGIQCDVRWRWVDALTVNNGGRPGSVPGYSELGVRVAFPITTTSVLSIMGENLLHDHHPEYGPPILSREEIRRTVYAKLSWSF